MSKRREGVGWERIVVLVFWGTVYLVFRVFSFFWAGEEEGVCSPQQLQARLFWGCQIDWKKSLSGVAATGSSPSRFIVRVSSPATAVEPHWPLERWRLRNYFLFFLPVSLFESQSRPSYMPSPVVAHVAWMYHARLRMLLSCNFSVIF